MADASYVVALDGVRHRAELVWSAQVAAGVEKLSDPDEAVEDFHRRLSSPLDTERMRQAWLEAVRSA